MDLNKLTLGDKILGGAGILLFVDLLLLPWHDANVPGAAFLGIDTTSTGLESPNAFWGVLAWLLCVAIVAVIVIRRLTTANLPELPIPLSQALFYGAIATLALLFIKLISETSELGIGSWLGLLLGAAMVYGGFVLSKEGEEPAGPLA